MEMRDKMTEQMLESAACEALGANSVEESAAYQQQLTSAGEDARKTDRSLRETVSRLSSASFFMAPPPDLRGRILQATAPTTFRMEDYRKAVKDNSWLYKWGFYAATLFLMAAAWFNTSMRNEATALRKQVNERNDALAMFVNPKSRQVTVVDGDHTLAKFLVDDATQKAIGLVSQESLSKGVMGQLALQEGGKTAVKYETAFVSVSGDYLSAPPGKPVQTITLVRDLTPESAPRVYKAGIR